MRITLPLVLTVASGIAAAQPPHDCGEAPAFPTPGDNALMVDEMSGQAVFQRTRDSFPLGGITDACIWVLDVISKNAVSTGQTGDRGVFELTTPVAGQYILIADHPEFSGLAARVRVRDRSANRESQRGLLLRMGDADREYAGYASEVRHLNLRREILEMYARDQDIRNELIRAGMASPDPDIAARMAEIDTVNTSRLISIIDQYGWPDLGLVGHDATSAAFALLQHAEYAVQKQFYPLLEAAYRANEASGQSYALLTDRILTREGRPQIYGTQARPTDEWIDGEPAFFEIEDEAGVDERRAEVGLPSLAEYAEMMRNLYFPAQTSQPAQSD